jgi:hypothetical protein
MEVARAIDQLLVTTFDDPFEQLESRFKELERRLLLSVVSTQGERREVRRRIAETLFTEAFSRGSPWPVFGRALRRIQRLGYSHVERRYHVACLYAQWCREHPEHDVRPAILLLEEAERAIRRLPRNNPRRQALLARLAELRSRTGFPARS